MGEVYLATDTRLGNDVALKRTTVGDDEHLAAAFEREARTLAGLRHRILPNVTDHFTENEEQFLVMDFIAGEDLSDRLKKSGKPFPLNWVLFWADQLLEALSYLHTNVPPIIHRDIKPQNLKLTADNQIVLLDFGLSKNSIGNTRVTTSGSVVGYTPHYAPIEQIRGTGTSPRSDLYALSATLYQLLSNTVPPDALLRADTVLAGSADPLQPLTDLNPEISDDLAAAITRGMEITQDKRFADARQMQKALRRAYGAMQESMSADTVAFSAGEQPEYPSLDESDAKTEVNVDLPESVTGEKQEVIPNVIPDLPEAAQAEEPPGDKTEVMDAPVAGGDLAEPAPTAQFVDIQNESIDEGGEQIEAADLSDFETAGADDEEPAAAPSAFDTQEDFSGVDEAEAANEEVDTAVPVYSETDTSADEGIVSGGFETQDEFGEPEAEPAEAEVRSARPTSGSAPPPKKPGKSSAGKYIAILLGLGAVFVLILGSLAGGLWYYTRGVADTGNENSEPPPPTLESTVEDALPPEPVNANTENTNTLDENVNSDEPLPTPATDPTPGTGVQTRPTVRRTPAAKTPVKKTPVRPPPTAKPKPTKKKDPGVI